MMLLTSTVKLARACFRFLCAIRMGARFGKSPKLRRSGCVSVNWRVVERDGFTVLKELFEENLVELKEV